MSGTLEHAAWCDADPEPASESVQETPTGRKLGVVVVRCDRCGAIRLERR